MPGSPGCPYARSASPAVAYPGSAGPSRTAGAPRPLPGHSPIHSWVADLRHVVVLILVIVALVLQDTAAQRAAVWGVPPDVLVILVVELAFRLPRVEGMAWPWGLGLAADLHGTGVVGVLALTYGLIAIAIDRLREFFFTESLVVRLVAVAAGAFVEHAAVAISQILRGQGPSFMLFWKEALVGMVYTAALAALLLPLIDLALRRVLPKRQRG